MSKRISKKNHRVYYVWFHHMALLPEDKKYINKVIKEHDFYEFKRLLHVQETCGDNVEYLPKVAYMLRFDGTILKEIDVTKESNFIKICDIDCECG